jgi:hypothetical protein
MSEGVVRAKVQERKRGTYKSTERIHQHPLKVRRVLRRDCHFESGTI